MKNKKKKTKNKTKLQKDAQHVNTAQTPHFCGYAWLHTPRHGRAPEGRASPAVTAVCPRRGREQKGRSYVAGGSL